MKKESNEKVANGQKVEQQSMGNEFLDDLVAQPKIQQALTKLAVKQGTVALQKYKHSRRIVEEGVLRLKLFLHVEDRGKPLSEVSVDDLILGYINQPRTPPNEGTFKVECYKKGNGKWDEHTIQVAPIGDDARYFKMGKKTARFAPTPDNPDVPVAVYINIKRKRHFGLIKSKYHPSRNS